MKSILRKLKRIANWLFGAKTDELYWKFRHIFDSSWAKSYISDASINHPHRKVLIDAISNCLPFESILEIGCASGPNLYLVAKKFPKIKIYGIDVSGKAIETGRTFLKSSGIKNAFLEQGGIEKLKEFENKSIDVIFSDATLIYLGPAEINLAIKEMGRVGKKAIILCEQNSDARKSFYNDRWIHNYKTLCQKLISFKSIKITKLPKNIWSGDWAKMGAIIEVFL